MTSSAAALRMVGFASWLRSARSPRRIDHSSAERSTRDLDPLSVTDTSPSGPSCARVVAFFNSTGCAEERKQKAENNRIATEKERGTDNIKRPSVKAVKKQGLAWSPVIGGRQALSGLFACAALEDEPGGHLHVARLQVTVDGAEVRARIAPVRMGF